MSRTWAVTLGTLQVQAENNFILEHGSRSDVCRWSGMFPPKCCVEPQAVQLKPCNPNLKHKHTQFVVVDIFGTCVRVWRRYSPWHVVPAAFLKVDVFADRIRRTSLTNLSSIGKLFTPTLEFKLWTITYNLYSALGEKLQHVRTSFIWFLPLQISCL